MPLPICGLVPTSDGELTIARIRGVASVAPKERVGMNAQESPSPRRARHGGGASEVFRVFLKLGLTSFGGPIAHLGYFRRELVERRRWVSESDYAQLLALCQFLPGPASSQLGLSLGLLRGGWWGALAAFVGFTLPSALLLLGFAWLQPNLQGDVGLAATHGLKLVALVVVAHGVLGMTRQLCPDRIRVAIATASAVVLLLTSSVWMSVVVVVGAGVVGGACCRDVQAVHGAEMRLPYGRKLGWSLLAGFVILLLLLPLAAGAVGGLVAVVDAFYRAGALVFGGGHVVLPLLEDFVVNPGWIARDEFLAGYGAAQAVPGPMFSVSAYLGARLDGVGGLAGASVALLGIFLPGFLLILGVLPAWSQLARRPGAARVVAGVNAAVVGLLGAALYDPIWTSAVRGPTDLATALVGFALLVTGRGRALAVVGWCVAAQVGISLIGW